MIRIISLGSFVKSGNSLNKKKNTINENKVWIDKNQKLEKYMNDKEAVNISRNSDYNQEIIREMQNETICMLLLNSSQS